MRELYDVEGNAIQVPDDTEINDLKSKADVAEKLKGLKSELGLSEQADLESYVKELHSDAGNRNWRTMRQTVESLKTALKDKGHDVDVNPDTGELVFKAKQFDEEEIIGKVREETTKTLVETEKKKALSKYDEKVRPVIEHYFNKLSSGEAVSLDNLNGFIADAEKLAGVNTISDKYPSYKGQPPVFKDEKDSFANSDRGKEIAKSIFGDQSYAKEDKK
jgi:hypothetical protein